MLPKDVHKSEYGMVIGEEAKHVRWTFPTSMKQLEILQLTDVQWGHIACKTKRVIEYRDWVLSEPNRFVLLTGDLIDLWTPKSPGSPADYAVLPNERQLRQFLEVFAPLRHRVLGYVGGNHERRTVGYFGDLGRLIAAALRVPYSGGRQLIDIQYGQHKPFKISLWHGVGGARTKGTIAQILHRFMSQGDSQLYLMGHLHQPLLLPLWKEHRRSDDLGIEIRKCIGMVGSSFMETWGSYGEISGYTSSDVMMARAVLEPNGKWEVTLK